MIYNLNKKENVERILTLIGRDTKDSESICKIYDLLTAWFDKHPWILDSFNISRLNSNFRFACLLSAVSLYEKLPADFFKLFIPESIYKIYTFIFSYVDSDLIAA